MRVVLSQACFAAIASAQYLIESSSFGQGDTISPNRYGVPGWHISGEGQVPELLSDKVVLTSGYKGNTRGAMWAEASVPQSEWISQFEFRASGSERGGGNLQLWYTKEGQWSIGSSSIYTVGAFDGMAIVIDPYGGKGGGIRGFMNDGTIDYKNYHSVDSLAFGHCDYAYRNLGRPSKLQIKQGHGKFELVIDDKMCFSTDKIQMPKDYYFGITAASAESPDSFEVYKLMVFTSNTVTREEPFKQPPPPPPPPPPAGQADTHMTPPPIPPASEYKSSDSQFADLHDRLIKLSSSIDSLNGELSKLTTNIEGRHHEVMRNLPQGTVDKLNALDQRLGGIERMFRGFDSHISNLGTTVKDSHSKLADGLTSHVSDVIITNGPRMGLIISIFVVVQIVLVGAYQIYRRKIKQGPKKYL